jgi:endogenous inhibitor of DNA gyrase (YacG/DUF329 family)
MPMPAKKPALKCPVCGKPSEFDAPPLGPFCSTRCKMVDLGKWLGEEYRVSEPLLPSHFEEAGEVEEDKLDQPER